LRFFAVARSNKEVNDLMQPIAAIWSAFYQDWNHLCRGVADLELSGSQTRCVVHVNRDLKMAFINDWSELCKLIKDHNTLYRDIGNPAKVF